MSQLLIHNCADVTVPLCRESKLPAAFKVLPASMVEHSADCPATIFETYYSDNCLHRELTANEEHAHPGQTLIETMHQRQGLYSAFSRYRHTEEATYRPSLTANPQMTLLKSFSTQMRLYILLPYYFSVLLAQRLLFSEGFIPKQTLGMMHHPSSNGVYRNIQSLLYEQSQPVGFHLGMLASDVRYGQRGMFECLEEIKIIDENIPDVISNSTTGLACPRRTFVSSLSRPLYVREALPSFV